ncbi:hypothetical protein MML48_5g00017336 [Holotrichia oblita]|uniref:Uncharacterized protein n=1 Tax=Holotrichia oblita TaxID=644536 RepID=A0ACB9T552_HOLOL|nr:hypothetical protein MML48_5g00017336 [Holotrichia oblita]
MSEDTAEWLKNITAETDLPLYIEKLRERTQYYKEESEKIIVLIERIKLLLRGQQQCLPILEGTSLIDDVSRDCCMLSEQEKLRKYNYYVSKIKYCIKMYTNLNEKLLKDIKVIKTEIDNSKSKIDDMHVTSKDELKYLEAKVKRYENELIKLEKKHPWLKNLQFNLPNIGEQIEKLNYLRCTKEKLQESLAAYRGLKPRFDEAKKQLREVQEGYKQILEEIQELA